MIGVTYIFQNLNGAISIFVQARVEIISKGFVGSLCALPEKPTRS